jgi:hypothetical protein
LIACSPAIDGDDIPLAHPRPNSGGGEPAVDAECRTTLLLALSGGCPLLASRTDGSGRYGAVVLAMAAGALSRDTLTDGTVE